jgi:Bacterial protein of unknown function (DUF899)
MGWWFPWVSTYGSDFAFDFDLALTKEQMSGIEEIQTILEEPPDWLVGGRITSGPSWRRASRRTGEPRSWPEPTATG